MKCESKITITDTTLVYGSADKNMSNVIYKADLSETTDISDVTYEEKAPEYTPSQEELDITDYIYDSEAKSYTYEDKEAAPVISIEENTEPAQIWMFTE